jgi:hypothetical protein
VSLKTPLLDRRGGFRERSETEAGVVDYILEVHHPVKTGSLRSPVSPPLLSRRGVFLIFLTFIYL